MSSLTPSYLLQLTLPAPLYSPALKYQQLSLTSIFLLKTTIFLSLPALCSASLSFPTVVGFVTIITLLDHLD